MNIYERATVRLKLINKPNRNRLLPIVIRVCVPGYKNKDYGTGRFASQESWDDSGEHLSSEYATTLLAEKRRAEDIIQRLKLNQQPFTWESFDMQFMDKGKSMEVLQYIEVQIGKCKVAKTRNSYKNLKARISAYSKKELMWTDINYSRIKDFIDYLEGDTGNGKTSIGIYFRTFKGMYNRATHDGLTIKHQEPFPFGSSILKGRRYQKKVSKKSEVKRYLTKEEMAKIIETRYKPKRADSSWRLDLDIWTFSYWAYGVNLKDIMELTPEDIDTKFNAIRIRRSKSGNKLYIPIIPPMQEIINKYVKVSSVFMFPKYPEDYNQQSIDRQMVLHNNALGTIRDNVRRVAEFEEVKEKDEIDNYTPRHSFAVTYIMDDPNASIARLGEYMGHSSEKSTRSYIRSLQGSGDTPPVEFYKDMYEKTMLSPFED